MVSALGKLIKKSKVNQVCPLSLTKLKIPPPCASAWNEKLVEFIGVPVLGSPMTITGSSELA